MYIGSSFSSIICIRNILVLYLNIFMFSFSLHLYTVIFVYVNFSIENGKCITKYLGKLYSINPYRVQRWYASAGCRIELVRFFLSNIFIYTAEQECSTIYPKMFMGPYYFTLGCRVGESSFQNYKYTHSKTILFKPTVESYSSFTALLYIYTQLYIILILLNYVVWDIGIQ